MVVVKIVGDNGGICDAQGDAFRWNQNYKLWRGGSSHAYEQCGFEARTAARDWADGGSVVSVYWRLDGEDDVGRRLRRRIQTKKGLQQRDGW
jgi:hypothetical protein